MSGWLIQNNIVIAHEKFYHVKTKREGKKACCVIEVDMSKAHGRIEREFLHAIMYKMGFLDV